MVLNSKSKCKCAMDCRRLLASILIIIGFTISETTVALAQSNQLNGNNSMLDGLGSDTKRIILTWLNTNGTDITQSDPAPSFIIDKRDFFEAFSQLFENSNITTNEIQ